MQNMREGAHFNEQEFIQAYDTYADPIFRHCALRLGDRELGKDLMQEAFLRTWEYVADGKAIENIRAFLYKIANNLIIDHVRQKKRRREDSIERLQEEGKDFADHHATTTILTHCDQVLILEKLQKIEEPYRSALVLRHIDGFKPQEIADLLGVSANVVSVRIDRALKKLRSLLGVHE